MYQSISRVEMGHPRHGAETHATYTNHTTTPRGSRYVTGTESSGYHKAEMSLGRASPSKVFASVASQGFALGASFA